MPTGTDKGVAAEGTEGDGAPPKSRKTVFGFAVRFNKFQQAL